jgi:CDP-glycerol glycerophosphotransferase
MKVVYNSFAGRYSDSPRAIYEALLNRPGMTHTWLVDPLHRHGFPPGTDTVRIGADQCLAALEAADVVVSNTHIELDWRKGPATTYLQTWHGTPLKHIHFDSLWAPPGRVDYLTLDVRRWDHLLSPNRPSTDLLRRAFGFTGEILETGYPRNDLLSAPHRDEVRAQVRKELGIAEDTTVVLYVPTWRDDLLDGAGRQDFACHLNLDEFTGRLGADHVLLLRLHPLITSDLPPIDRPGVVDVSLHPDIGELYLAADVMITDYSSAMFDFAVTGKPQLFFTYDLAYYRDELRGFYFDIAEHAPGPLLRTSADVIRAIGDLAAVQAAYRQAYVRFQARFCALEDGHATARVVDRFFPS